MGIRLLQHRICPVQVVVDIPNLRGELQATDSHDGNGGPAGGLRVRDEDESSRR